MISENWPSTPLTPQIKLALLKNHLETIPERFVLEAYTILNRATIEHAVWSFEDWFNEAMRIIEGSQFTTNDDEEVEE